MVNTTILENKIEALTRRLANVVSALEATAQPRFKVATRYRLKCDIAHTKDNFVAGDIVRAIALEDSLTADVMLFSERSEETADIPLKILDGWVGAGALEEV